MKHGRFSFHPFGHAALALAIALSATAAHAAPEFVQVKGDRPTVIDAGAARPISALASSTRIGVTITLPLTRRAKLDQFVADVSDPSSSIYGHYLSPGDFAARYGASAADYDTVLAWAKSNNLAVTQMSLSRSAVSLSGTSAQFEQAFGVKTVNYVDAKNAAFFAPATAPKLPAAVASVISGVYGLSSYAAGKPLYHIVPPAERARMMAAKAAGLVNGGSSYLSHTALTSTTGAGGTGHDGAFSPADLNSAYQMPTLSNAGKDQALGCFELGGFYPKDPVVYEKYYKLPATPVIARLIAGSDGAPLPSYSTEAALDIEAELALAPHASAIYVYEDATNPTLTGSLVDALNAVADDDKISALDISYGLDEVIELSASGPTGLADEGDALKRCAAEGISVFASSGDSGAYGAFGPLLSPASVNVSDPASQPYVTGVGGTTMFVNDGFDYDEITWNELGSTGGATGGGVSDLWKLPSYQKYPNGVSVAAYNGGSSSYRNVPDVAAVADSLTPVDVYSSEPDDNGVPYGWIGVGGTSASAPIWAGFTAVVDQQRHNAGIGPVGFVNPLFYTLYDYSNVDFNDVVDGSNGAVNLTGTPGFEAGYGYDNTTGCGTLTGSIIMADLVALPGYVATQGSAPTAPHDFREDRHTDSTITLSWSPAKRATGYIITTYAQDYYYFGQDYAPKFVKATTQTHATIGLLSPDSEYEFSIAAVNANGSTYDSTDVVDLSTPKAK